tara:strand:+ start:155 stop:1501 length:1347 start_codon:yes stop_codon:yes gene_type:complete
MNKNIPRRTFLKGFGAAISLPMLDSMAPIKTLASSANSSPIRMACMFVPNGIHMEEWKPSSEGAHYDLTRILKPLSSVKRDITILSGLTQDKGRANGDGAGDHARCAGVFLTGVQPLKSQGSEIRAGVSVDQFAAQKVGHKTRFASLELGTERGRQSGKCDSGYSCAYSNNISWRNATTPMAKETNPRAVFERLFGNDAQGEKNESLAKRQRYRKSILDFVLDDARSLTRSVSGNDKVKLDEYLTAVREIEQRIEKSEKEHALKPNILASIEKPDGVPTDYGEHIRLMGDMMILAFQTDVTRISTFMLANAGSNRSYRNIGVSEGHHSLSHHQNDKVKLEKISKINTFHVEQLSYIIQRMKSIREGEGSMLDNTMILYGSGISDGNKHNNENLPIVLAGRGGGLVQPGRHIQYREDTPLNNLFVSMLNQMGANTNSFNDSTGSLPFLT